MTDLILKVAARWLGAKEHASEDAREQYLKDHPKADPSNHTVKKGPDRKKKPEGKSKPAGKETELSGIFKPDAASIASVEKANKAAFDKITREAEKEASKDTFNSRVHETHLEGAKQYPELQMDATDLMAKGWKKMSSGERVIHLVGHKLGQHFESGLSKAEMKLHDNYFERWRTSAGSYDQGGYGQPEDFEHESQELQGLAASLGVVGSQAPEDLENNTASQGGVEKARKKGAKDPKLTALAKKMYDYQQAYFKHLGIKEVTLYRGVKGKDLFSAAEGSKVTVGSRELASFTADPNVAKTFGRVIEFKVPVERIFASSLVRPGIGSERHEGSFNEAEMIVMGASELEGQLADAPPPEGRAYRASEGKGLIEIPISDDNESWLQQRRPKEMRKSR